MKQLAFLFLPVPDLQKALAFYRDTLGWKEAWREGDTTASLELPGVDTQLMLDATPDDTLRPGPVLLVDDVRAYYEERKDELRFVREIEDVPGGGHWGAFVDPF